MTKRPLYIYVCDRGFVYLGRPHPQRPGDDARFLTMDDFGVVRNWGTTEGLGQLARHGPQPNTKIDMEPDGVEMATQPIFRRIPCVWEGWDKWPTKD